MDFTEEKGDATLISKVEDMEKNLYMREVERGEFISRNVEVVSRALNRPTSAPPLLTASSSVFMGLIRPNKSEVELACGPLYRYRTRPELDLEWIDLEALDCDVTDMVSGHGTLKKPVTLRMSDLRKVEVPKSFEGLRLVYGGSMSYIQTTTTYHSDELDDPCYGIVDLDAGDGDHLDVDVKAGPDDVIVDGGCTDDYVLFEEGKELPPIQSDIEVWDSGESLPPTPELNTCKFCTLYVLYHILKPFIGNEKEVQLEEMTEKRWKSIWRKKDKKEQARAKAEARAKAKAEKRAKAEARALDKYWARVDAANNAISKKLARVEEKDKEDKEAEWRERVEARARAYAEAAGETQPPPPSFFKGMWRKTKSFFKKKEGKKKKLLNSIIPDLMINAFMIF